jgi:glycosyltransferase involved in cell wall biosynthesis
VKRLIIIDYNVTAGSPSMKGMLRVLPELLKADWQVTVWSHKFDSPDPRISWIRFPGIPGPWVLKFLGFSALVHLAYFKERLFGRGRPPVLWQSTGTTLLPADVVCIHFISSFYLRKMKHCGAAVPLSEKMVHGLVMCLEKVQRILVKPARFWLVVSRRLAADLQAIAPTSDQFRILPNSYDAKRWNPALKADSHVAAKADLGLGADEPVLAFVGLGSFIRKGLPLALQACQALKQQGIPVRLLVIGGASAEAPDITALAAEFGVTDLSFLLTHGRTTEVPRLLAASDGLLFPSYFEAFSLVEIEAAALGLRLYLTDHYGSEMLLEDGVNGRILPWEVEGIVDILKEELKSGAIFRGAKYDPNSLIPDETYGRLYCRLLDEAWQAKQELG